MRSQVIEFGGDGWDRTTDLRVMKTRGGKKTAENSVSRCNGNRFFPVYLCPTGHIGGHFPTHLLNAADSSVVLT